MKTLVLLVILTIVSYGCDDDEVEKSVCSDGIAQEAEDCDGGDLKNSNCEIMGFYYGTLSCKDDCTFDTSQCYGVCGDGIHDDVEDCDGEGFVETCSSLGLGTGNLICTQDCLWDTSGCEIQFTCGDGLVTGNEECDGNNFDEETCTSLGYGGGDLNCTAECQFDTSGCEAVSMCGDEIIDAGEDCDGSNMGGETCETQGYSGGTLNCSTQCSFDFSACGNSEIEIVCGRWNSDRQDMSEGTWSGSVATCNAGDISSNGRANALKLVNLYRWIADLPAVTTDSTLDAKAQECALMMTANGQLNHSPPGSWDCYTSDGAQAAGSSNLAGTSGVSAVDLYMADPGNPTTIGHRRWILSNSFGPTGLGSTNSYSCMWAFGSSNAGKSWTAWPSPGVFPFQAVTASWTGIDSTGWTLQSDSINLNNAQVTITMDGTTNRPVNITQLGSGYGSTYAISMIPQGWTTQAGHVYTVTVTGVTPEITYDVEVTDCTGY